MKIHIPILLLTVFITANLVISCSRKDNSPDPVTDIEGNVYKTVRIGDQVWMAENLKVTTFSDGEVIPVVTDSSGWNELNTPGICWYYNDAASNRNTYGALYNFYAVNTGRLCPEGWKVPSIDDFRKLRDFIGDTLNAGGELKEEGTEHWESPNTGATNRFDFTALPSGIRYFVGTFNSLGYFTAFWSSSEAEPGRGWYLSLYYSNALASIGETSVKNGFSIRCIKK